MRRRKCERLSQDFLREYLRYDPETGKFWPRRRQRGVRFDRPLGTVRPDGYRQIYVNGALYLAHRLAWFYVHGRWPTYEIDHRDTNRDNNWLSNLRDATGVQNQGNRRGKTSGPYQKGIRPSANGKKWIAGITQREHRRYLGTFDTSEEAAAAYEAAARDYFGEFARTR